MVSLTVAFGIFGDLLVVVACGFFASVDELFGGELLGDLL